MKKLLLVAVILALILSCISVGLAEESADPYFGRFDETVVIRVVESSADEPGVWTFEDNPWTREWLERFNIDIELMWNTGTTEEFATKFSMAMLTGDLPDIMELTSKQYRELLSAGKLADLTEVYERNVYPFLKEKVLEAQGEAVMNAGLVDGARYAIPMAELSTNARSIYIRRDYREKIGAELPTTIEEVVELGKAFVDEGLAKYALLLQKNVTGDGYSDMQAVANAFGAYPGIWVNGEDGKLVYSPTTEGMKQTLNLYKELYDGGYIQPTFATEVGDNVTAYITNGEIGILPADFWVASWPLPLVDESGDVIEWDIVPVVPSETNTDFHVQGTGSLADIKYYCVNANFEHPEAIITLFNHICAMLTDPDLQQMDTFHTLKNEDGTEVKVFMQNPMPRYFSTPRINMMCSVAVEEALSGNEDALYSQPQAGKYYGYVKAYLDAKEAGDKEGMQVNWANYRFFGGKGSIFYSFYENFIADNYIWDQRAVSTENYDRLWGSLKQYENTFYVNYICGTEDTTFEEFVQEWYSMGGALLTDELNEQ